MKGLEKVKLFADLDEKELKKVARHVKEITHPAGTKLAVRGAAGLGFMVILEGKAEVQLPNGRVEPLTVGDHFGEMSLLDKRGRSANVVAVTDIRLGAIPEWGFKAFLAAHPEVSYKLLQEFSRRLRTADLY